MSKSAITGFICKANGQGDTKIKKDQLLIISDRRDLWKELFKRLSDKPCSFFQDGAVTTRNEWVLDTRNDNIEAGFRSISGALLERFVQGF